MFVVSLTYGQEIQNLNIRCVQISMSAEVNLEQGKILANITSILLLLNDADNIKCSRSNVKYVTQVFGKSK